MESALLPLHLKLAICAPLLPVLPLLVLMVWSAAVVVPKEFARRNAIDSVLLLPALPIKERVLLLIIVELEVLATRRLTPDRASLVLLDINSSLLRMVLFPPNV